MSISFSGLATGLDTSSWVESLVKIKQEKVSSYESTKKTLELTQEAVASIKSFFTSFRSVLEKVTDTKFGTAASDIFAQKLASSTNANLVSASATHEAEEAKYDVNVDKLATQTKANSGIKQLETITQIQTATLNTKLGDLGVKNGTIDVTVKGVKNNITISEENSIADFITKLKNVGVDSNFNEKTGVFSVDLPSGNIVDNGTGIIDAFHLQSSGYESTNLVTYTTSTVTSTATGNTQLSELDTGKILENGIVEVNVNGATYTISVDGSMTLSEFVGTLKNYGADAELADDGTLTIKDATITDIGNTKLLDVLGLHSDVSSKSQTAEGLKTTTIITTGIEATGATTLGELDGWKNISGTPQLVAVDAQGNTTTVEFTETSTLDEVVSALNNAGLKAELKNGTLSVTEGSVSGNVTEVLGLTDNNIGRVSTTGKNLYTTMVTKATGDTKLADLGIKLTYSDGQPLIQIDPQGNSYTITSDLDADMTINDYFAILKEHGINASISDGKITVEQNGHFDVGTIAQALGINHSTTTLVTANSASSTAQISYTITKTVDESTTFGEMGLAGLEYDIKDSAGNNAGGIFGHSVSSDTTFADFISELKEFGITLSLKNGVISLSTDLNNIVTGDLAEALGIQTVSTSTGVTTGQSVTSTAALTYTTSVVATGSSKISDFVDLDSNDSYNKIQIMITNFVGYNYNITSSTTFDELINELQSHGIEATLSDGKLQINNTDGKHIKDYESSGGILSKLGITTTTISSSTTTVSQSVTGNQIYYTMTVNTEGSSLLKNCVTNFNNGETMTVYNQGTACGTITVNNGTTIDDLYNSLQSYGVNVQKHLRRDRNNILYTTLELENYSSCYVKGTAADRLWTATNTQTVARTTTIGGNSSCYATLYVGKTLTSSYVIQTSIENSGTTSIATRDTKLWQFNKDGIYAHYTDGIEWNFYLFNNGKYCTVTLTHTESTTIGDMMDLLADNGIETSFSDGKLTIKGGSENYIQSFDHVYTPSGYTTSSMFDYKFGIDLSYESCDTIYSTATENTTLSKVSSSYDTVMTLSDGTTIRRSNNTTIGDLINTLQSKGIEASLQNGKLTIKQNSNNSTFIKSIDSTFAQNFGLKYGENETYYNTVSYYSGYDFYDKQKTTMFDFTTLTNLGISTGTYSMTFVNSNSNNIKTVTFSVTSTSTVNDYLNWLTDNGYTGNSINNGKITIGDGSDWYIFARNSDMAELMTKLGLTAEYVSSYCTEIVDRTYGNTNSNKQEKVTEHTVSDSTTFSELGLAKTGKITISYKNGNPDRVISIHPDDSFSLLAQRTGLDISIVDGELIINGGSSYITRMDDNLKNVLKLARVGNGYTYTVDGETTYKNVTDGRTLTTTKTGLIDKNTVIKNIDGYNHGDGTIKIKDKNGNDAGIITIDQDSTLEALIAALMSNSFSVSINDGIFSIGNIYRYYLESVSGGSNILDALGLKYQYSTIYNATTDGSTITQIQTVAVTGSTKLKDLFDENGNTISSRANLIGDHSITATIVSYNMLIATKDKNSNWSTTSVSLTLDSNINSILSAFEDAGINAKLQNGKIVLDSSSVADFNITCDAIGKGIDIAPSRYSFTSPLDILFGDYKKTYDIASDLNTQTVTTAVTNATRDTLLKDLGVTSGEYYVYNNGVRYTALISDDETIGSFMDNLKSFGLQTGLMNTDDGAKLMIIGNGNSYIAKSNSTTNASNVVEKLFSNITDTKYNYIGTENVTTTSTAAHEATKDTLLSEFDYTQTIQLPYNYGTTDYTYKAEGTQVFHVRGENITISISATDTFGSYIDKLNDAGIASSFHDGKLYISHGYDVNYDDIGSSSYLFTDTIRMFLKDSMSGFMASGDEVQETTNQIVEKDLSAANYADYNTVLGKLNIADGTFSIFRNGQKALIDIDSTKTFGDLRSQIAAKFSDVDLKFEDGKLVIYSKTDGVTVEAGTTTDTSNLQAVVGLVKDKSGMFSKSTRELYRVSTDTLVTAGGMFRLGDVTEGTFTVGNQEITIGKNTKLSDIINQINNSEAANATAYWDSIGGRLVIQSRTTGAALINIEAGTSNFTDIMGYTNSKWNSDGSLDETRLSVANQELGSNAKFTINGTKYSATSNTITSDITKIKGLTLNLKDITENNPVTITIEKDKDKVANTIESVVDSYNELMKNVDEQISTTGKLHDQSTLKMIRNQLRTMMTGSDAGATVFRNLSAIGISVSSASANNTSTSNESIIDLSFDRDKFLEAYAKDADAVKALLVGGASNQGVFTKVENLLESSLKSVTGYFDVTEKSIKSDINKAAMKITKANEAIERYRAQLEKRFSSMNMMIAGMQQQYSSFLQS